MILGDAAKMDFPRIAVGGLEKGAFLQPRLALMARAGQDSRDDRCPPWVRTHRAAMRDGR
jgi:hypothetical protein